MKSEPGFSITREAAVAGRLPVSAASVTVFGWAVAFWGAGSWATATGGTTSAAAPATAVAPAPFKNPRRSTEVFLDFAISSILPRNVLTGNDFTLPAGHAGSGALQIGP